MARAVFSCIPMIELWEYHGETGNDIRFAERTGGNKSERSPDFVAAYAAISSTLGVDFVAATAAISLAVLPGRTISHGLGQNCAGSDRKRNPLRGRNPP